MTAQHTQALATIATCSTLTSILAQLRSWPPAAQLTLSTLSTAQDVLSTAQSSDVPMSPLSTAHKPRSAQHSSDAQQVGGCRQDASADAQARILAILPAKWRFRPSMPCYRCKSLSRAELSSVESWRVELS